MPLVRAGILLSSHGVHGLAKFACTSDNPHLLSTRQAYLFTDPISGECHIVRLTQATTHGSYILAKLDLFDAPEPIKPHSGWELLYFARRGELPRDGDEVYFFELPGLEVRKQDGTVLGRVSDVLDSGAHILLTIDALPQRLIPFTRQFVPIVDLEQGYLVTTYPLDEFVEDL